MAVYQRYGLRANLNLSDVSSRNTTWDNLGFTRSDLACLVNTSASGVTAADYIACSGLSFNLETQIVAAQSRALGIVNQLGQYISASGDNRIGSLTVNTVNNDRGYYDTSNYIYSTSTNTFFSTTNSSGLYTQEAQYLLGPVRATTTTISGLNFRGDARDFSSYYVQYKQYLQIQESPSFATRYTPTYLAPPTAYSSNILWFDSEYSAVSIDGSRRVASWSDVMGRGSAVQATDANKPVYTLNLLNNKPGLVFDGSNDFLTIAQSAIPVTDAATVVIVARVQDTEYNIMGNSLNTGARWRTAASTNGNFGLFVKQAGTATTPLPNFPAAMPANGTLLFSVRANRAFGLTFDVNKSRSVPYPGDTFEFVNTGTMYIGTAVDGSSGAFFGEIYAIAIFNAILSDLELSSVEEYFAWRYNFVYDPARFQPIEAELESDGDFKTENFVSFEIG